MIVKRLAITAVSLDYRDYVKTSTVFPSGAIRIRSRGQILRISRRHSVRFFARAARILVENR